MRFGLRPCFTCTARGDAIDLKYYWKGKPGKYNARMYHSLLWALPNTLIVNACSSTECSEKTRHGVGIKYIYRYVHFSLFLTARLNTLSAHLQFRIMRIARYLTTAGKRLHGDILSWCGIFTFHHYVYIHSSILEILNKKLSVYRRRP